MGVVKRAWLWALPAAAVSQPFPQDRDESESVATLHPLYGSSASLLHHSPDLNIVTQYTCLNIVTHCTCLNIVTHCTCRTLHLNIVTQCTCRILQSLLIPRKNVIRSDCCVVHTNVSYNCIFLGIIREITPSSFMVIITSLRSGTCWLCRGFPSKVAWNSELKKPSPLPLATYMYI